jgi:hypothetical protein
MPKKTSDGKPTKSLPENREATPPLLSEKLIAQLQKAVGSAHRKRSAERADARGSSPLDKDL